MYTFKLSKLVTFEPLEIQRSNIPLLKALMSVINAVGAQRCGCMSTFCHTPLKIAVLLHKTANTSHSFSETVCNKRPHMYILQVCNYILSRFLSLF